MLGAVRCAVAEDGSHWRVYQATSPGTAGPSGMNRTRDHMAVAGRAGHRLDRPRAATVQPRRRAGHSGRRRRWGAEPRPKDQRIIATMTVRNPARIHSHYAYAADADPTAIDSRDSVFPEGAHAQAN